MVLKNKIKNQEFVIHLFYNKLFFIRSLKILVEMERQSRCYGRYFFINQLDRSRKIGTGIRCYHNSFISLKQISIVDTDYNHIQAILNRSEYQNRYNDIVVKYNVLKGVRIKNSKNVYQKYLINAPTAQRFKAKEQFSKLEITRQQKIKQNKLKSEINFRNKQSKQLNNQETKETKSFFKNWNLFKYFTDKNKDIEQEEISLLDFYKELD